MSIAASDLILYFAANNPEDDAATAGGAIDQLRRPDWTQIAANDKIEVISTSASDTQNCTVEGRLANGTVASETLALTGTTAKLFNTNTFERITKVELASAAIGTITVRRQSVGPTLRTIPIGERGFSMCFRKLASSPSSTYNAYAKLFWLNNHGSLSLLSAQVKENADPDARITHALAGSVNDSATTTNRITSPGLTFDGTAKNVPGTDLAAGSKIGTWLNLTLPTADPPHRTTYTSELAGQST